MGRLDKADLIPVDFTCNEYIKANSLASLFSEEFDEDRNYCIKTIYPPSLLVSESNATPFPAEYDDLARLHYLCITRKATTILEFGIGKSSIVFASALSENKRLHGEWVAKSLRRGNAHELHAIDNHEFWIDKALNSFPAHLVNSGICNFHYAELVVDTFCGRACTYYDPLPNLCPDLIYLDGPDQFSAVGNIRGITTAHQDRMPMAADILTFEHFLQPGTLIIVDGRTANARFLRVNLQRDWAYFHSSDWDQHFFELQESPLGVYNARMIDFCLGDAYYRRASA